MATEELTASVKKTAVIYLRVSTSAQVNTAHNPEGFSIPAQREACRRHAEKLGATVIKEYVESGKSARTTARPDFQNMMSELGNLRPDFVIVYDLSRAVRDEFDGLWLIKELKACGSKLESTQEQIDDSDVGMLNLTLMLGVNAYRSRNDGKKAEVGLERKHRDGGTIGPARLGYLNVRELVDGHEVAAIAIDPERAPLIRLAFDLAMTGHYTVAAITEVLCESGLRSRSTMKRQGQSLGRATVHRMLTNDYYVGIVTRNGTKVPGRHEPLITREEFDLVQKILSSQNSGAARGTRKHHHYLAGHLVCVACQNRLGYSRNRGRRGGLYEYYTCLSRVALRGSCGSHYLRLEVIEDEMEQIHRQLRLTPGQCESVRRAVRDNVEQRVSTARQESARHGRRSKELTKQQQKLVNLYYQDAISVEVLKKEQARIEQEQADAHRWQQTADVQVQKVMKVLDEALALVDRHECAYEEAESYERRMLNRSLFSRIWVENHDENASDGAVSEPAAPHLAPHLSPVFAHVVEVAKQETTKKTPEGVWQVPASWSFDAIATRDPKPDPVSTGGRGSNSVKLAEREGFEPSIELPLYRLSKAAH